MADSITQQKSELQRLFPLFAFIAIICAAIAMAPALTNGWVNWDDEEYVINNPLIQELSFSGLIDIFSTLQVAGNYHPITLISLAIDYAIGGGSPLAFHLSSLLLHLLNVLLLGLFIRKLTGNTLIAFVVMLLFGIHPMHVESVAWVSARKDLLYTAFLLAGLIFYLKGREQPARNPFWWRLTIIAFILSLLSKGMAVIFPLLLILIEYYPQAGKPLPSGPRGEFLKRQVKEKLPLFILSALFIIVTYFSQKTGAGLDFVPDRHPVNNIFIVTYGISFYLLKSFLPFMLSSFHPYPEGLLGLLPWFYYGAFLLVMVIVIGGWKIRKRYPLISWGLAFFLISLLPIIQLVPLGQVVVAERYTYFAYIGLFMIVAWLCVQVIDLKVARYTQAITVLGAGICFLMMGQSFQRTMVWENGERLWGDVIEKYPKAFFAYGCRGLFYVKNGQFNEALTDFETAIFHNPDFAEAYVNRGLILSEMGHLDAALQDYNLSIQLTPDYYLPYYNRSRIFQEKQDWKRALADLNRCLALKEDFAIAYFQRAFCYRELQEIQAAQADAQKAISLDHPVSQAFLTSIGLTGE
jgi:tetratricopeptide (TPR) repeat protein